MRILCLSFLLLWSATLQAQRPDGFDKMCDGLLKYSMPMMKVPQLAFEKERNQDLLILDAREPEEFTISHVPGAINVGYDHFKAESIEALQVPKDAKIVVYCSVGYRSEKVAEKLQKQGYQYVYNLYGGIFDWVNSEYPVVDAAGDTTVKVHGYNKNWSKWIANGEKVY